MVTVQTPYSPRGDGNVIPRAVIVVPRGSDTLFPERGRKLGFQLVYHYVVLSFRHLIPREGTETSFHCVFSPFFYRSDTLFPERGRKRGCFAIICCSHFVQTPYSPRGDGNKIAFHRCVVHSMFRHLIPREGTETIIDS